VVEVPAAAAGQGLKVRIGSTTCRLWNLARWSRVPEVTREFSLEKPRTEAVNAFGGLVYIVVPGGCRLGSVPVRLSDAVEAPFFQLGRTSLADWRTGGLRDRPAPWAEIASDKAILTVPSTVIRSLDDPESLCRFWDRILDTCAAFAARPADDRARPERYVVDVQLCAGYMHAGYPIMIPMDAAPRLVDHQLLSTKGDWGLFHETGHNHQSRDWTFSGTGEVTVNLFTLYILDRVCGIAPATGRMSEPGIRSKVTRYFTSGPDFREWQGDPFLALAMYVQLQQGFGWEPFTRVFADYRALAAEERPKTDEQKRDQWLVRFSRAVGRDLGPFFQTWGVPISDAARSSIRELPEWLPPDFP